MEVELLWLQQCVQVGEGRTASDCWFRESGRPVHKVFVTHSGRLGFSAVLGRSILVDTGCIEVGWLAPNGKVSMRRVQSTIRKIHVGTLLKCAP